MAVLHRIHLPPALRVFVLGLLVLGLLMKPVLVVACEIDDVQRTLAGEHRSPLLEAPASDAGDVCCGVQNCGECCTPAAAVVSQWKLVTALPAMTGPLPSLSVEFEPTARLVAFRPPIAT